jgi:GNAT superfamily N-acetyltransferase
MPGGTWGDRFQVFAAKDEAGTVLGVLTLTETFALYANGRYRVIDEMYVAPEVRSEGVGARLVDAVKEYGRRRGWTRIDVTAPEDPRWERSRRFYEGQGFTFTGPKLKFVL